MEVLISTNSLPQNARFITVELENYEEFYDILDYSFHILKCAPFLYDDYLSKVRAIAKEQKELYICFEIKGQFHSEFSNPIRFYLACTGVTSWKKDYSIQLNFMSAVVCLSERD